MGSIPPPRQKVVIVGAGPVGSLAALFAASRGDDVEVYELRGGIIVFLSFPFFHFFF
jgi:kynurenine 3-monooxygenase